MSTPRCKRFGKCYTYNMTVNELIVQLDRLPADAEVVVRQIDSDENITEVRLLNSGEVLIETTG